MCTDRIALPTQPAETLNSGNYLSAPSDIGLCNPVTQPYHHALFPDIGETSRDRFIRHHRDKPPLLDFTPQAACPLHDELIVDSLSAISESWRR